MTAVEPSLVLRFINNIFFLFEDIIDSNCAKERTNGTHSAKPLSKARNLTQEIVSARHTKSPQPDEIPRQEEACFDSYSQKINNNLNNSNNSSSVIEQQQQQQQQQSYEDILDVQVIAKMQEESLRQSVMNINKRTFFIFNLANSIHFLNYVLFESYFEVANQEMLLQQQQKQITSNRQPRSNYNTATITKRVHSNRPTINHMSANIGIFLVLHSFL